jgi:hypothetical protein
VRSSDCHRASGVASQKDKRGFTNILVRILNDPIPVSHFGKEIGMHKITLLLLMARPPKFLTRDSFSFFSRAMRQNENSQWWLNMNINMNIKKYGISASQCARASESLLFELNGRSQIIFSGHRKDMKYVSNRFIQVCWSTRTLPLAGASTDSLTAYRDPKARRNRNLVRDFPHRKVVRTDFARCHKWTR